MRGKFIETATGPRLLNIERESWKEYFKADINYGMPIPPFYLPVRLRPKKKILECWIFPLWPFASFWFLASNAFLGVARDLLDLNNVLRKKVER